MESRLKSRLESRLESRLDSRLESRLEYFTSKQQFVLKHMKNIDMRALVSMLNITSKDRRFLEQQISAKTKQHVCRHYENNQFKKDKKKQQTLVGLGCNFQF